MINFIRKMLVSVTMLLTGCASMAPAPVQFTEIHNPTITTIIIPNDANVNSNNFKSSNFNKRWDVKYYRGSISEMQTISTKNKTQSSFDLERRTGTDVSGSGIVYKISYSIEDIGDNTIIKYKPLGSRTYKQGFILPFDVPNFTEKDLSNLFANNTINYVLELDSPYNVESVYANFKRLANEVPFERGLKDPITGKIFKNRFTLSSGNQMITFSLEVYPYRNGSKAVIYLSVPGYFTSDSTVDFNKVLSELKSKFESIVNS